MHRGTRRLGGVLADPRWGETARAFLIFALLFLVLAGITGHFAFRELALQVLTDRVSAGLEEAARIADVVAALGRDQGGINFHLLRQKKRVLRRIALERLAARPYVRHVEVRDRFGGRLLYVSRENEVEAAPMTRAPEDSDTQVLTVQLLRDAHPEGEVRVGIASDEINREIAKLRSTLRIKLFVAGSFAVGVLVIGFFYVLHLIRKNRQLEQSRLAAERRSYVGLLASSLAHEIRNPLNAMNMNLQMLEEELQCEAAQDEAQDLLVSTKQEIKRLENLVSNFLTFARPSLPHLEVRDLNAVLTEVATFLQVDFRQSGVRLELDLEPLLPTVEIDETQFKQAVMNLLVNARQVLGSEGLVRLVSRPGAGGDVLVEVHDDGPGMAPEVRERVFEIFYSSRGGGTGLGLPIARQIVEGHGGSIEVDSAVGEGTVFRIHLPRRHAPVAAAREAAEVGQ